jgi:hypothetical protein
MAWAFGWSGGRQLVCLASVGAKRQEEMQREKRMATREAKTAAAADETERSM